MILYKENFFDLSEEQRKNKCNQVYLTVSDLSRRREFELIAQEIKKDKTWRQTKAIHKLCDLLAPRFSESYGIRFDKEDAKLHIKWHCGYLRPITDTEAIAMASEVKELKKSHGEKMTIKAFNEIVDSFKESTKRPKSFADATLKEMQELIEKIHALADKMGWSEVRLTSSELEALVEYYNNKE